MDYPQLKRTNYPDRPDHTHTDQAHFRDFRDYHLPLARLQHTHLTWGIARGLEVRGTLGGNTITVEPGVAVDGRGQLLVLTREEERSISNFLDSTLYVTLQFAEGRGADGRLEQVPVVLPQEASAVESGRAEGLVVLALVETDGNGEVTALKVQDGARRFRRQLLGEQVAALELRRSVLQPAGPNEPARVGEVVSGTLAAGEHGGLRLTVVEAADEILVAREDGGEFRRVEIRADVEVSGTIEGTLAVGTVGPAQVAAGAVTSVHLAEADGSSGQEPGTGQGVKTGHLQDQAVTSPKIADATIQLGKLHPEVRNAIEDRGIGDNAVVSTMIAEADGITGQLTNTGKGVKTGHLQDQAVTAAKLQSHGTDDARRAVGRDHLQDQAVTAAKLQQHASDSTQRAVGATHLQANAVRSPHLQDQAVTAAKLQQHATDNAQRAVGPTHLQANAVGSPHLQANAVGPTHLQANAVTAAKLQQHASDSTQRAVGATHLQANAVGRDHLQDQAVTAAKLQQHATDNAQRAVGPTHLQANAVGSPHLQDQAVTAAKLQQHASDSTQRAVGASHIKDGAVQPAHLQANAVTAAKLQQHATDNTQRAVGTAHLQDNAVTAAKLQSHATDNAQRAVGTAHLQNGAVTSEKLGRLSNLDVAGRITGGGVLAGIWAAQPLADVGISTAGIWQDVPETSVQFTLARPAVVFFTYSINVQPEINPVTDWLATQLVIDGVSAPQSGSHFQPFTTADANMNLHGSAVLNLPATTHTVSLRWFKGGTAVASWANRPTSWSVGGPGGGMGGRTLIVMAFYQ